MARPASTHPTDGELEILTVLWMQGPCSLGEVHSHLQDTREVAKTTVATMLGVMLDKKLVKRKHSARGYVWQAAVTHQKAANNMVDKLLNRLFDGSAHQLAVHLIRGGNLSDDELSELQSLIAQNQPRKVKKGGH